ncbi:MAG TPA: choice-of-anchor T family protein [Candidatus Thermoplasmatota archaeon]|nr:choice-of-anchor T family protein [Candidatus Thermoplasmatota archaeon]
MTLTQKIARASIATILLVSTVSALSETAAAQNPVPVIAITLLPSERVAPITASQQAAVTFTGNYTVDKLNIERAQVSFTAVVTTGWVATVSPASITVTNVRTGPFSVTVVVPAGTSATEVGQLTVTGRVIAGGLQSQAQAQAIVTPKAYFRTIVSSTTPFMESSYSTQVVLVFRIYNEGNVRDQIRVTVKNLEELSTAQWIIVMSRQSFTIEPTLFSDVQVSVGLPKEFRLVSDNKVTVIEFQASSGEGAAQNQPFEDMLPVFIRTVGFSLPGFEAPIVFLAAIAAAALAGGSRQRKVRRILK